MYSKGVELYLAPTADARDTWQFTLRHIACEGRCFVLGCNQFVTKAMYPADLDGVQELAHLPEIVCRGGSVIIAPLGDHYVTRLTHTLEVSQIARTISRCATSFLSAIGCFAAQSSVFGPITPSTVAPTSCCTSRIACAAPAWTAHVQQSNLNDHLR
jgi:hypothetical protein